MTDVQTRLPGAPAAIDVVMPVFNAAATIESAIRSILDQSFRDFRLIVVDDGSSDETPMRLATMAAADPRILVLRKANSGIVDALNLGLAHCSADHIARQDADDISLAERLGEQHAYLVQHLDVVAVASNARHIDGDGVLTGHETAFGVLSDTSPTAIPSREPYLMHPFLMVRRQALSDVGGYRHAFHAEDTDLYWRLARHGRLVNLPQIHGLYRVHAASITSRSVRNGRIGALAAQLSAIDEARFRAGAEGIAFPPDRLAAYERAETLADMLEIAGSGLTPGEREFLADAASAKLLELTSYRQFHLDRSDMAFMRKRMSNGYRRWPRDDALLMRRRMTAYGVKMLASGRLDYLRAFAPWWLLPRVIAKYLMLRLRAAPMKDRRHGQ